MTELPTNLNSNKKWEGVDPSINLPKGYLSPSAIGVYQKCPKKYELRYIYDMRVKKSLAAVKGSAIHKALEFYYKDKKKGIKNTDKLIGDYAIVSLEELSKEEELPLQGTTKDTSISEVFNATSTYVNVVGHKVIPVDIEKELNLVIAGVPVLGYMDLSRKKIDDSTQTDISSEDSSDIVVCDHKSSSRRWSDSQVNTTLQFHIYAMAEKTNNIEVHNIVLNSVKTPSIYVLSGASNTLVQKHVTNIVRDVAEAITKGNFPRCSLDSWWCNEKWCEYYSVCFHT